MPRLDATGETATQDDAGWDDIFDDFAGGEDEQQAEQGKASDTDTAEQVPAEGPTPLEVDGPVENVVLVDGSAEDVVLTPTVLGGNGAAARRANACQTNLEEVCEVQEKHLQTIKAVREKVRDRQQVYDDLREQTKAAKKAWETAVEELGRAIDEGPDRYPLLEHAAEAPTAVVVDEPEDMAEAEAPVGPDAWRSVELEDIGVPEGVCKILHENPGHCILTLGHLADWTQKHQLTKIPRIGRGKADVIEKATDAYWAAHPPADSDDSEDTDDKTATNPDDAGNDN
jgi:hypothetical protein